MEGVELSSHKVVTNAEPHQKVAASTNIHQANFAQFSSGTSMALKDSTSGTSMSLKDSSRLSVQASALFKLAVPLNPFGPFLTKSFLRFFHMHWPEAQYMEQ